MFYALHSEHCQTSRTCLIYTHLQPRRLRVRVCGPGDGLGPPPLRPGRPGLGGRHRHRPRPEAVQQHSLLQVNKLSVLSLNPPYIDVDIVSPPQEDGGPAGGGAVPALHGAGAVLLGQARHRQPAQEPRAAPQHAGGGGLGRAGRQGHPEDQARRRAQDQDARQPLEWGDGGSGGPGLLRVVRK